MNSQDASEPYTPPNGEQLKLLEEISAHLRGLSDADLYRFFTLTKWWVQCYASGYELDGPLFLVLDNCIIQDFKHRKTKADRALKALAYTTFCRFVKGWSDRPTYLAVTAVAIYEHLGRKPVSSPHAASSVLSELKTLLADTELSVTTIGFNNIQELQRLLHDVHEDANFLLQYVQEIDAANWQCDLKAPIGVRIPMSIACEAIPDNLPLKYFDPWYVKFVLESRIEQLIIEHSQQNPDAMPIGCGEMSIALSSLNEVSKKKLLKGLGDIDLLQVCDINRQYKQKIGYVLLGQTVDKGLAEVLRHRHTYHESVGMTGGSPNATEEISKMVNFMLSNPFAEQDARRAIIRPKMADFLHELATLCKSASIQ
ncbi:MAG TPA: hypothetical protein VFP33_08955 [Gallionella sp.]|nr:hypothetical protein [Gallionella sp.]